MFPKLRSLAALLAAGFILAAPAAHPVPIAWDLAGGGGSPFSPVNDTYASAGTFTETIPTGSSQVVIEDCGSGGSGGGGDAQSGDSGGGAGSGAYVKKTFALTSSDWGTTFSVSLAAGSTANGANLDGNTALASTVTNGTYGTATSLSAGGGAAGIGFANGSAAGSGGTASGGDVNTSGNAGTSGPGGTPPLLGGSGVAGIDCTSGKGGNGRITTGTAGTTGSIWFEYT